MNGIAPTKVVHVLVGKLNEVHILPQIGIINYKKNSKDIKLIKFPLEGKHGGRATVIYSSNNFLKQVHVLTQDLNQYFYIMDEANYLSKGELVTEDLHTFIKITDKYYVSQDFDGNEEFIVAGNMVITKTQMILLQPKGSENFSLHRSSEFIVG